MAIPLSNRLFPISATTGDVRMVIPLSNREKITDIYFHRSATSINDEVVSTNLESKLGDILDKNGFLGKYSRVTIKSVFAIKKNPNVIANVIFPTYHDAVSAIYSFNGRVYEELINEPISVRLGYSRIIKCQQQIYACLIKELDHVRESAQSTKDDQEKYIHINIHPAIENSSSASIVIRSWHELSLNETVR